MGAFRWSILIAVTWLGAAGPAHAYDMTTYAIVQDDATLKMRGKTVHLFGIHVPDTGRDCRTFIRPAKCASRAALALDFKKGAHFVHCDVLWRNEDRSVTAQCSVEGEDLSKYLISRGWAVALPNAPFEYKVAERIARRRNLGVWSLPADVIQRRP